MKIVKTMMRCHCGTDNNIVLMNVDDSHCHMFGHWLFTIKYNISIISYQSLTVIMDFRLHYDGSAAKHKAKSNGHRK